METLRVLVCDDEPGMRLGVECPLRNFTFRMPDVNGDVGFSTSQVDSGERALEVIAQSPPDILLLDHKMPGISGLEVLDRLAGMKLDMLTIMITAYASIETAVTATRCGAYDFLAKPFTPTELKGTIRKAAARILLGKQARKLAQEKHQVRLQFIRVLGHELKAPLNALEGYLNMLKDRGLGETVVAYDSIVDRSLVRIDGMRKLIADLLDITQIESGQKNRRMEVVNLREAARAALESQLPEARSRNIALELHAAETVPLTADRGEIDMILNNLLSNAVKYNRDSGKVDVTLQREESQVRITVADTGIGLTEEEGAQLFGEFVRIRNEKTANILGSGLGLSIVQKLAQLYGGNATFQSQPDVGTVFTVVLNDP